MTAVFSVDHRRDSQVVRRYRVRADDIEGAHRRVRNERVGHERKPGGDARDQLIVTGWVEEPAR